MVEKHASILVVDDEPDLRLLYELTLAREGYRVETAETVAQARQLLQQRFDVVLTDMRLPDGVGMELLLELQAQGRPERCVVVTAYGSAENAIEALRAGAFDYLSKPVELKQLRTVILSAIQGLPNHSPSSPAAIPQQTKASSHPVDAPVHRAAVQDAPVTQEPTVQQPPTPKKGDKGDKGTQALVNLVGQSAVMLAVKERISKVARSMAPVHIHGESGTGKELVARALHANSQRADGPLVAVNCGAIPENLLEAEFFGAKKGSYTGATQDRQGFFQAAKGGTLFLDEIGDLPLAMQTKLLRAIQERSVRPLGATQEEVVDVRLVSATHRDLAVEVAQGRFRQDLYYRLNVIELRIPPLRDRREDLPALLQALLVRLAKDSGFEHIHVDPTFMQAMLKRNFPGNVRELENLLHRAVALSEDGTLRLEYVQDCADGPADSNAHLESGWGGLATSPSPMPAPAQAPIQKAQPPVAAPPPAFGLPSQQASGYSSSYTVVMPLQSPAVAPAPIAKPEESVQEGMTRQPMSTSLATPQAWSAPSATAAGLSIPVPPPNAVGVTAPDDLPPDLQAWLDEQEKAILIRALKLVNYNRTVAASLLGLNLRQIRYRIERLNIPTEPENRQ